MAEQRSRSEASNEIPILKLSIRSVSDYRDITIRLTLRSLLLILWIALMIVLLYEVLSVWILFLLNRNHRRPFISNNNDHVLAQTQEEEETDEEAPGRTTTVDTTEPLPLVTRTSKERQIGSPNKLIVLLWGISTAYAIFYSFEAAFLYMNERWYQLLGIQLLLTTTDVCTWIQLVATCKYGVRACWPLTQACVAIKLLHLLFNIFMESRESIFSARHWMFLLEDSTYLWCCRLWLHGQPRKLLTGIRSIVFLVVSAAVCALLLSNMTSMNRITRV